MVEGGMEGRIEIKVHPRTTTFHTEAEKRKQIRVLEDRHRETLSRSKLQASGGDDGVRSACVRNKLLPNH